MLGALEQENPDPAKDAPGLHIRGFSSSLDISTQHYRLYVPSTYQRGRKLPLLIIMPTTVSASRRPFIESAFIANHRSAVRMSRVAERHGFALLWPGYRNIPDGLPCENAHLDEVLKAVQADYDLDLQRVHLHGICSGGIFAGNAAAKWPGRFASIIYNRAIFRRDWKLVGDGHLRDWMQCCDPAESILRNKGIAIFLTNTESALEGHGGIELAREFIDRAAGLGKTVTADLSPPAIDDMLWERVFRWAASCKLERPDMETSDWNSRQGYSGPVLEVFATPMIVVQGTSGSEVEKKHIVKFIQRFQQYYAECFYGAACRVIKDTELGDADITSHSLIVIGNPKTNKMWRDLQGDVALETTDAGVVVGKHKWDGKLAYHLVLKNRRASSCDARYILFMGATDMECLGDYPMESLFRSVCDFEIWRAAPEGDSQPAASGKLRDFITKFKLDQIKH
jgi:hypothetical protein